MNTPQPPTFPTIKKIMGWNFAAAIVIALFMAGSEPRTSEALVGTGAAMFFLFPVVNILLLIVTAFRKTGSRAALLGFLLATIVMPLIGFAVCLANFNGNSFH